MAKSTEKQRRDFFDRYAKNLTDVKNALKIRSVPDIDDVFACPLCFNKFFTREALGQKNVLTLEHVPPKAVGGRVLTLTCQDCNSNSGGAKLDSQLALKLGFEVFASGQSSKPLWAKVTLNDRITIPVDIYSEGTDISIFPPKAVLSKSKPQVDAFTESFVAGSSKINLRFKRFSPKRANLAIMRSAYLLAFSRLGYGFLINPSLRAIRGQLIHPDKPILPTYGILRMDFPDEVLGINTISTPQEARAYLIVFDLFSKEKMKIRHGVILPSPYDPGLKVYEWLSEKQGTSVNYQIEHVKNDIDFLEQPLACFDLWNSQG